MEKITLLSVALFGFLLLCGNSAQAQLLLKEIPLEVQVSSSSDIIEGELISKKSYWNTSHTRIYTVNTFKVLKIFKGQVIQEIKIVTRGGKVGDKAELVTPSVKFRTGNIGLIMLHPQELELDGTTENKFYATYSSVQGFYPYSLDENKVYNTFRSFNDIETEFYQKITTLTGNNYVEVSKLKMPEKNNNSAKITSMADITSISPTTASAGTKTVLTITGTNFGNSVGKVGFKNADSGGMATLNAPEYIDAYDTHIISWSDTQILVQIPSFAGTGEVRVKSTGGIGTFFSDNLTIIYAHLNPVDDGEDPSIEFLTQLYAQNGEGGYTLNYFTEFAAMTQATLAFEKALNTWVCGAGVNLIIGANTTVDATERDNTNVIRFAENIEFEEGVLATTATYYSFCEVTTFPDVDVFVDEIDQVFNSEINWNFTEAAPTNSQVDFETVAVHELGHAIQLGHVIDQGAIMHYAIASDIFNRNPEANDIIGAEAMLNRSVNEMICGLPPMVVSACSVPTEDLLAESILVYPNPVNSLLNIKTAENVELKNINLYDPLGRLVISKASYSAQRINTINIASLSSGIYFLEIKSTGGPLTKKIIIQ